MGKKIKTGFLSKERCYETKYDWPEDCFCQGGDSGIVLGENGPSLEEALTDSDVALEVLESSIDEKKELKGGSYRTAFFEAFPRDPNTYIRGEGKTLLDAEEAAWEKFQRYCSCKAHDFEKRGYNNGAGFCKHCGMFGSKVFPPTEKCCYCEKDIYENSFQDKEGKYWCLFHTDLCEEELLTEKEKKYRERIGVTEWDSWFDRLGRCEDVKWIRWKAANFINSYKNDFKDLPYVKDLMVTDEGVKVVLTKDDEQTKRRFPVQKTIYFEIEEKK